MPSLQVGHAEATPAINNTAAIAMNNRPAKPMIVDHANHFHFANSPGMTLVMVFILS